MKFTNGYWQMRPGVTPHYAAHVYKVKAEESALTVFAPTRLVQSRGDTLNLPVMTVRYTAPLPNVIRVQIWHHKGELLQEPAFEVLADPEIPVTVRYSEDSAMLKSGDLSVQVMKGDQWHVAFKGDGPDGDRLLTSSGWRAMGYVDIDRSEIGMTQPGAEFAPAGYTSDRYIHEQLALGVGEVVYGLGERFGAFAKNGQVIDMWNADGGTSSEQTYKNVPFYMTNRGYGVFVAHPELVSFEIASEKVERVQFSVPGERLEYYVIYGPSPKEVLERYTALTGRPALPPAWSFGLWLSTSFTTNYDEETVTSFIQGMADRTIPLSVFHFDCFWMEGFHWINLEWDPSVFPDPAEMLARLKARGLRICVWINPYVAQQSALFDEAAADGYLLERPDGSVWQWDRWQAGMGLVDFTNPDARRWYGDKLRALVDMGVDCFKTDFGERIPTDVVYHDGSDPVRMHNYYSYLYNQTVFELLEEARGQGEAVVFARSATTGGQRFPVHWGGDSTSTFESMAETLRGGLSLGLSGFGFWSHDIGGFESALAAGASPADVYKRWCAFGLLSSHSRLHGSGSYRVPWQYDDEAVDVLRHFTVLKCRLMPYLFAAAIEAVETGVPMLRAMVLEFPDDPGCDGLDRQYMLGEALLVAPVFSTEGAVDVYVPEGRWTDLLTGEVVEGGGWMRSQHDFMSLPLFARPNSIIAFGAVDDRPDYDYADGVTFHLFALDDGATTTAQVASTAGAVATTVTATRAGDEIRIETEGSGRAWSVLLRGIEGLTSVEGGAAEGDPLGTRLTPEGDTTSLVVRL
jgi:alpha-D-xyloside xylohydrolase